MQQDKKKWHITNKEEPKQDWQVGLDNHASPDTMQKTNTTIHIITIAGIWPELDHIYLLNFNTSKWSLEKTNLYLAKRKKKHTKNISNTLLYYLLDLWKNQKLKSHQRQNKTYSRYPLGDVTDVEGIDGLPGTKNQQAQVFPQQHGCIVPHTILVEQLGMSIWGISQQTKQSPF